MSDAAPLEDRPRADPATWMGRLKLAADAVGVALFCIAFAGFILQVFARYVLNSPLRWTEELTMIAFIWAVFWAAAFMVRIKDHVSFEVVYDLLPDGGRRALAVFAMAALVAAFLVLIPYTWEYVQFLARRRSPVLRVSMQWVYGCYLLFVVAFTAQACWRLRGLLGRDWRRYL